jgi:AAA domain, putative AbiEii toxin, Type IV TA system
LRISKIKFDPSKVKTSEEIYLDNVTLLVGPHNSGKSQTLRDVNAWCWNYPDQLKLVKEIEMHLPSDESSIRELLNDFMIKVPPDKTENPNVIYVRPPYTPVNKSYDVINLNMLTIAFLQNNISKFKNPSLNLLSYFVIRLDGKTRFDLIKDRERGNMHSFPVKPVNDLDALFRKDDIREELRKITYEEFGWNFYISHIGPQLKIVLDKRSDLEERNLADEAVEQFNSSEPLDNFGDGIKCFIGILVATLSYNRTILLIDEPEAFLNPSSARSLGRNLSSIAVTRDCTLIVATQSADFLMGCLNYTKKITICRLTYDYEQGSVTRLDSNDIKTLSTDPILKSVDSLSALFHRSAVVCESEVDKAFYHAANTKLGNAAIPDNIFLNVNGKDGIYKLVKPLRKSGIPVASVYDFDVIQTDKKNKGKAEVLWKNILSAHNIDDTTSNKLKELRSKIYEDLAQVNTRENNLNIFKSFKRDLVSSDHLSLIDSFLEESSSYGIFIVPVGELESWLPNYHKNEEWLTNSLNWMETINFNLDSLNPILCFLMKIKTWIQDGNRKGMPN